MEGVNRSWRLAARPDGMPGPEDWDFAEAPLAEPGEGEVLVEVGYVSLDPAMRGWIREGRSYVPPVQIGEVMRAFAAGRVLASNAEGVEAGDHVMGLLGVQEYAVAHGAAVMKVDPAVAPLPVYLGTLGMPGLTAYFGLLDVGALREGETVVVSAASGAVGSVVGQIAKLRGARAVGIAGGPAKCAYVVDELGFDAAIDYKEGDLARALGERCPDGIDVYFDNVGGRVLDAALLHLAQRARVVICGAISQYNAKTVMRGPSNYMSLLVNRATMTGFVVSDFLPRWPEAVQELSGWYAEGRLRSREHVVEGLEAFPEALNKLFTGENFGKLVLEVARA